MTASPPSARRSAGALPSDAPVVSACLRAPVAHVFAVLIDAGRYPEWLVGAQHIRHVDPEWPTPGSGFDHVVGLGPVRVKGRTEVREIEPPHHLLLEAGLGWLGSATVAFDLDEAHLDELGGGGAVLAITERPSSGIIRHLWRLGGEPVLRRLLWGRNQLSVERLRDEVEPVASREDR